MSSQIATKARQGILTSLFCLGLAACDSDQPSAAFKQLRFNGPTMGTEYNVSVVLAADASEPQELAMKIGGRLEAINQRMSTYLADSELSRLNRDHSEDWIRVSDELFAVLNLAQQISEDSSGAFDITVGPLVNLWGFGPGGDAEELTVPSDAAIQDLLQQIGHQKLALNAEQMAVKKLGKISLDLSAVAKGYAADEVSQLLFSLGYANHMVEVGGEVMAQGHNSRGQAWRIGIETPSFNHGGVQTAIAISGVGVATSGDYRNFYVVDGRRYSHTIDPTTGRPITHDLTSVTVIAPTAAEADAYATAINVLGFEAGMALAEQRQLAVYFIIRRGETFATEMTASFNQYIPQG